jgi:hypothetical protein
MAEEIRGEVMARARETVDFTLSLYDDLLSTRRIFPVCIPHFLSLQEIQTIRMEYENRYPLFKVDSENFLDKEGSSWFTMFYFRRDS